MNLAILDISDFIMSATRAFLASSRLMVVPRRGKALANWARPSIDELGVPTEPWKQVTSFFRKKIPIIVQWLKWLSRCCLPVTFLLGYNLFNHHCMYIVYVVPKYYDWFCLCLGLWQEPVQVPGPPSCWNRFPWCFLVCILTVSLHEPNP